MKIKETRRWGEITNALPKRSAASYHLVLQANEIAEYLYDNQVIQFAMNEGERAACLAFANWMVCRIHGHILHPKSEDMEIELRIKLALDEGSGKKS